MLQNRKDMNTLRHSDEAIKFRRLCRSGSYCDPTAGKAAGFAQVVYSKMNILHTITVII